MKTDSDLEQITKKVWFFIQGDITKGNHEDKSKAVQLLRSIQIDALRHAKEMLDQSQSETPVSDLQMLIRQLELK